MPVRILLIVTGLLLWAAPVPVCADDATRLAELNDLRERYPHDVDHALARAQLFARLGNDDAALHDLREASDLAPDYEDVWRVRYTVLARQNGDAARAEQQQVVVEAARRFPESLWWRAGVPEQQPRWTLVAGAGHDRLDNGQPSWNQLFTTASRDMEWGRYRFGVSRDSRFNEADLTLSLGADLSMWSDWTAGLDVAVAPDPAFQSELAYGGYVGHALPDGWLLNLRYLRREYPAATVGSLVASVEKYIGDFRIAYALGSSHLHGAGDSLSHRLTGTWYYSDRASIGLNIYTGEESEAIGAGRVLQTDVSGTSISGRQKINERMHLDWWLGIHEQGDFYRRSFLGMAVTFRL